MLKFLMSSDFLVLERANRGMNAHKMLKFCKKPELKIRDCLNIANHARPRSMRKSIILNDDWGRQQAHR